MNHFFRQFIILIYPEYLRIPSELPSHASGDYSETKVGEHSETVVNRMTGLGNEKVTISFPLNFCIGW